MPFIAEYETECVLCGGLLEPGQVGRTSYDGTAHERCPEPALEDRAACPRCHLVHGLRQEECT